MEFNEQTKRRPNKQLSSVYVLYLNELGECKYCIVTSNILRIPGASSVNSPSLYWPISLNMPKYVTTRSINTLRAREVFAFLRCRNCVINLNKSDAIHTEFTAKSDTKRDVLINCS
jgi:hypothetical protein